MLSCVSGDVDPHHLDKCCLTEFSVINLFTNHSNNNNRLESNYANIYFFYHHHHCHFFIMWMLCMWGECACMFTCMWVPVCQWRPETTVRSFL